MKTLNRSYKLSDIQDIIDNDFGHNEVQELLFDNKNDTIRANESRIVPIRLLHDVQKLKSGTILKAHFTREGDCLIESNGRSLEYLPNHLYSFDLNIIKF